MDRFVYFLRPVGAEGPVKVGCSYWPEQRLQSLMAWSPVPLEIVATIAGDMTLERRFHALFVDYWSHGEWFQAGPVVVETLAGLMNGTFDTTGLPAPKVISGGHSRRREPEHRAAMSLRHRVRWCAEKRGEAVPEAIRTAASHLLDTDLTIRAAAEAAVLTYLHDPALAVEVA